MTQSLPHELPERLPDLEALALFITVDEMGSVGAAARRFGISQPAASQRLRRLERQLGLDLLDRRTSGSTVTATGRVVSDWATELVTAAGDFARDVRTLSGEHESRLRIAASLTVADYLMPTWLMTLNGIRPDVAVSLQPMNSENVIDLVLGGNVELGFVEGPRALSEVRSVTVGRDDLVLVVAQTHAWATARTPLTPHELAQSRMVLREPGSGTRQVLDRALSIHGESITPYMELGSTTSIKQAVASGRDASVLSRLTVRNELAAGRLIEVPLAGLDLSREFRAIWQAGWTPTGPAGTLLSVCTRAPIDESARKSANSVR